MVKGDKTKERLQEINGGEEGWNTNWIFLQKQKIYIRIIVYVDMVVKKDGILIGYFYKNKKIFIKIIVYVDMMI